MRNTLLLIAAFGTYLCLVVIAASLISIAHSLAAANCA